MKKMFIENILIILAFIAILLFLWLRFIRSRLPKEIPIFLNDFNFFFLFCLIIIYLYIIIRLIKPKNPTIFILKIMEIASSPFIKLDNKFKKNKIFIFYVAKKIKIMELMIRTITFSFLEKFYLYIYVIPRIIIITVLIFEVFIISKIDFFYTIIVFSVFPLMNLYIKYSIKKFSEELLVILEKKCGNNLEKCVFEENIKIEKEKILQRFNHTKIHLIKLINIKLININFYNIIKNKRCFNLLYHKYIFLIIVLDIYDLVNYTFIFKKYEFLMYKTFKIIIFCLYCGVWIYIFLISLSSIDINSYSYLFLKFIFSIRDNNNPFVTS